MADEHLAIAIVLIVFSAIGGYIHGSRSAEHRGRARKGADMRVGQPPGGVVGYPLPPPTCEVEAGNALIAGTVSVHHATLDFVNGVHWSIVEVLEILTERTNNLADGITPEEYRRSIDDMVMLLDNMDHGECLTPKELRTIVQSCTSHLTVDNYKAGPSSD